MERKIGTPVRPLNQSVTPDLIRGLSAFQRSQIKRIPGHGPG